MPREPAISDIHLNSIIACLNAVLPLLNNLHDGLGTPFVQAISNTTLHLLSAVQNVKNNKDECVHLMKDIHEILFAIAKLHMHSEPQGSLPPSALDHMGKFTNTLHKIHTFLEGQREKTRFKHFLCQSEMRILFKECQAGLQQALEIFKIETSAAIVAEAVKMQAKTEKLHEEVLDLISNMTEGCSDRTSSVPEFLAAPSSKPKIFHGRESELQEILQNFSNKEAPRVAILGTGGIGKTSLAKASLHHPDISAKYEAKLFVACDSATTSIELAALVGSNMGLRPGRNLTKSVVQHFAHGPPCLLVLDNLETSWEPIESRGGVEEFLSLLSEVSHLALIITMRGAERPSKVHWTHPFLPPLKPLADHAARQTFTDITDNDHDNEEITQLLELTDNMPLAVTLLANLVDYEGCSTVLGRWKTENTYMLSEGHDKSSNLNSSITISLSCPRMTSGAKDLLSLLSILPDGLSNIELLQSILPVPDLLTCKAVLLQTSLAYTDSMRLKVLVPIRDLHPENLENPGLKENIYCIISFNSFRRLAAHGRSALMDQIPPLLPHLADPRLETNFTIELLLTANYYPIPNPAFLIDRVVHHLENLNDPSLASKFYWVAGGYYHHQKDDMAMSLQFFDKALTLAGKAWNKSGSTCILEGACAKM
ncbi:P-loop containing nucleoside triphosphate hydrolase protein [Mycena latifolia]|nr:P-loop containing nucleoside triphosphate hydrolase protein [Mycena latifolia]